MTSILVEAYSLSTNAAGSEARTGFEWLQLLSKMADRVVVMTGYYSNVIEKDKVPPNCEVVSIPVSPFLPKNFVGKLTYILQYKDFQRKVVKEARKHGAFDWAIHVSHSSFTLGTELHRLNIPFFVCGTGAVKVHPSFYPYVSKGDRLRDCIENFVSPSYLKKMRGAICANATAEQWLKRRGYQGPTLIIPDAMPGKENIKKLNSEKPYFFWAGGQTARKGGAILESAWKLRKKHNISLSHVGPREIKGENIEYLGKVSVDKFNEILAGAAAVVVPSYREGFPTAAAQAMRMDIPVISFDGVGPADGFGEVCIKVPVVGDVAHNLAQSLDAFESNGSPKGLIEKQKLFFDENWGAKRSERIQSFIRSALKII